MAFKASYYTTMLVCLIASIIASQLQAAFKATTERKLVTGVAGIFLMIYFVIAFSFRLKPVHWWEAGWEVLVIAAALVSMLSFSIFQDNAYVSLAVRMGQHCTAVAVTIGPRVKCVGWWVVGEGEFLGEGGRRRGEREREGLVVTSAHLPQRPQPRLHSCMCMSSPTIMFARSYARARRYGTTVCLCVSAPCCTMISATRAVL